jgi:UDP-glucose 4-epimerase
MRVLVTGGAGYIGSVVVEELLRAGHAVVVLDNLSRGHADAVAGEARLVIADLRDGAAVRSTLRSAAIEAVVHMAADSLVGESVAAPAKYYENNVVAGLTLLGAMAECGVRRLVFSSTAAVYGEPERQPIVETDRTCPTNPYGATKLAVEQAFPWYARAYGLRATSLRYFNAAGASERCGERHDPETHLIPLVLQAAADPAREVKIFGDDYPTPDGTCVRDYIHVVDLARAHVLALAAIDTTCGAYNLGCGGAGHSVRAVIEAARAATGRDIRVTVGPRRPGDPAVLVASSTRIQSDLGWRPRLGALEQIVGSAWRFMRRG